MTNAEGESGTEEDNGDRGRIGGKGDGGKRGRERERKREREKRERESFTCFCFPNESSL